MSTAAISLDLTKPLPKLPAQNLVVWAQAYADRQPEITLKRDGYLMVYARKVVGWWSPMPLASDLKPGTLAVPLKDGTRFWLACGGDDDQGAATWDVITIEGEFL